MNPAPWKPSYVRWSLVLGGLFYLITAAQLLLNSLWFYERIGHYPPYNRHYAGDTGAFALVAGLVLLASARHPMRFRAMVAAVAVGSLVHALNHVGDDFILAPSVGAVGQNLLLFLLAGSQFLAVWWAGEKPAGNPMMTIEAELNTEEY